MLRAVERDFAEFHDGVLLRLAGSAPQDALHAQHEFARAEGLGHVVVRAEFKTDDAVHFLGLCGEHEDRDALGLRTVLERLANFESGHAGQHEIQHDERGKLRARGIERAGAVVGFQRGKARVLQAVADEPPDVFLVLCDQDFLAGDFAHGKRGNCAAHTDLRKRRDVTIV